MLLFVKQCSDVLFWEFHPGLL